MTTRRLVLAADLDGTLAAGDRGQRDILLEALGKQPSHTLIYVTGRSEDSARALIAREQLPTPAVLISDVGTSVLRGLGPERMQDIEQGIAQCWPGSEPVRVRLAALQGLEPQPIPALRRASYWIARNRELREGIARDDFEARAPDDLSLSEAANRTASSMARRAAAALGGLRVDVLVSANVYLDVLPRGVNKGSTLLRVIQHLGFDLDACIVAGDSFNDLALFEIGAFGILVGNCEPALRAAVPTRSNVYFARETGAGGILEGLRHVGLLPGGRAAATREGSDAE